MTKYLYNFASKNMIIAFNFNAFLRNSRFNFNSIFWLIFPLRKITKNNNFKEKYYKIQMNNIFCQIFNKFLDILGFKNAKNFNRKTKNVVFPIQKT